MAGIFGTSGRSTVAERLGSINLQTSAYGSCIPVVYGRARVAGNMIYHGNFTANPVTTRQGGKGGGPTSTEFCYTADVALGICEGPVEIGTIWRDREVWTKEVRDMYNGILNGLPVRNPLISSGSLNITLYGGRPEGDAWTVFPPGKRIGYGSTAYGAAQKMDLGSNAQVPNHAFEVVGFCAPQTAAGDVGPADVLLDMLTHPVHGMGFPAGAVANLDDYRLYCREAGLFVAGAFDSQRQGVEAVKALLDCTNSIGVWSGGKLRILPLADLPVGGWSPNSTPLYALTHDDFLSGGPGDDPVQVTRKSAADAHNSVKVKFRDRAPEVTHIHLAPPELMDITKQPIDMDVTAPTYVDSVAEANDLAMQDLYGLRPAPDFSAELMADPRAAQTLAQIRLQRSVGIRNEYKFRLGWRYTLLEPGDLVTLTEPGLGLENTPVRITAVEEDAEGDLSITAEDWPNGIATAVAYPPPDTGAEPVNVLAPPPFVDAPVIFEPPADLTSGDMQLWIGASGSGPDWGGCEIWAAAAAGGPYRLMGRIDAPARHSTLYSSAGPSLAYFRPRRPLLGGGDLAGSTTPNDMSTLSAVVSPDGSSYELFTYRLATPQADFYSLGGLQRGLFGTAVTATWPAGAAFMRLDTAVARLDFSRWQKGTIHLKFPSFNAFGLQRQSLADVQPVAFNLTGAGTTNFWQGIGDLTMTITPNLPA